MAYMCASPRLVDPRIREWHDLAKLRAADHAHEQVGGRQKPLKGVLRWSINGKLTGFDFLLLIFVRNSSFVLHIDRLRSLRNDCDQGDAPWSEIESIGRRRGGNGGNGDIFRRGRFALCSDRDIKCRADVGGEESAIRHAFKRGGGAGDQRQACYGIHEPAMAIGSAPAPNAGDLDTPAAVASPRTEKPRP